MPARDAALPAVIAVLGCVELANLRPDGWAVAVPVEVLACLLLVWRRTAPLVVGAAAPLVILVLPWVGPRLDEPATPILILTLSIYTLARRLPDLRGLRAVAVVLGALAADYALVDQRQHGLSDVVFVGALMVPPFVFGRVTRALAEQKAMLETTQEQVRREAARHERQRIARELHDVIAHSVSAMVVQTAAAQDLVRTDPGRAERVLADVASVGRQALAETGRLLHVVRDEDDELGLAPAPGLGDLSRLVDGFRTRGLTVDLEVHGRVDGLPDGVDVSAYRVVQEALTNALRHGDGTVAVRLIRTPDGLEVRASNPVGRARPDPLRGTALGLVGMAERVSLLGGELSHHRTPDGRFELVARLPAPHDAGVAPELQPVVRR